MVFNYAFRFVNTFQEKIQNDIKKLKIDKIEQTDSSDHSDVDLCKEDIQDILHEANGRNSKNVAHSRFSIKMSVSTKAGHAEAASFYRNLMAKEQRSAEKSVLSATYFKPKGQRKKIGGRGIFN